MTDWKPTKVIKECDVIGDSDSRWRIEFAKPVVCATVSHNGKYYAVLTEDDTLYVKDTDDEKWSVFKQPRVAFCRHAEVYALRNLGMVSHKSVLGITMSVSNEGSVAVAVTLTYYSTRLWFIGSPKEEHTTVEKIDFEPIGSYRPKQYEFDPEDDHKIWFVFGNSFMEWDADTDIVGIIFDMPLLSSSCVGTHIVSGKKNVIFYCDNNVLVSQTPEETNVAVSGLTRQSVIPPITSPDGQYILVANNDAVGINTVVFDTRRGLFITFQGRTSNDDYVAVAITDLGLVVESELVFVNNKATGSRILVTDLVHNRESYVVQTANAPVGNIISNIRLVDHPERVMGLLLTYRGPNSNYVDFVYLNRLGQETLKWTTTHLDQNDESECE